VGSSEKVAITKRDRHGRALDGTIDSAEDFQYLLIEGSLNELYALARRVRGDRNAKGAPPGVRARVREDMRPFLREAVRYAAQARTALLRYAAARAGSTHALLLEKDYQIARLLAQLCVAKAQIAFRQPYMEERDKAMSAGKRGGRQRKADLAAELALEYDERRRASRLLSDEDIFEDIAAARTARGKSRIEPEDIEKLVGMHRDAK
jgi:hypothetical protein